MICNIIALSTSTSRRTVPALQDIPKYIYYPMWGGFEWFKLSKNLVPENFSNLTGISWNEILAGNNMASPARKHRFTKNNRTRRPWKDWNEITRNLSVSESTDAVHFLNDIKNYILKGGAVAPDGRLRWRFGRPDYPNTKPSGVNFTQWVYFGIGIVTVGLGLSGVFTNGTGSQINPMSDFHVSQYSMFIVAFGVYLLSVLKLSAWIGPPMISENVFTPPRTAPFQPRKDEDIAAKRIQTRWRGLQRPFGDYTPYFQQAHKLIKSESRGLFGTYPHIQTMQTSIYRTWRTWVSLFFPFVLLIFCTLWVKPSVSLANSYFDKIEYKSDGCTDENTKKYIDNIEPEKIPANNGDVSKLDDWQSWKNITYILWFIAVFILILHIRNLMRRWIDQSPVLTPWQMDTRPHPPAAPPQLIYGQAQPTWSERWNTWQAARTARQAEERARLERELRRPLTAYERMFGVKLPPQAEVIRTEDVAPLLPREPSPTSRSTSGSTRSLLPPSGRSTPASDPFAAAARAVPTAGRLARRVRRSRTQVRPPTSPHLPSEIELAPLQPRQPVPSSDVSRTKRVWELAKTRLAEQVRRGNPEAQSLERKQFLRQKKGVQLAQRAFREKRARLMAAERGRQAGITTALDPAVVEPRPSEGLAADSVAGMFRDMSPRSGFGKRISKTKNKAATRIQKNLKTKVSKKN